MNFASDDHLQQFRAQSDQAFAAMQATADREMAKFLSSYGQAKVTQANFSASSSAQASPAFTAPSTEWDPEVPPPLPSAINTTVNAAVTAATSAAAARKGREVSAADQKMAEKVAARKAKAAAAQAQAGPSPTLRTSGGGLQTPAAFNDFGELGDSVRGQLAAVGQDAAYDAKGWLRNAALDLGERAKREATAMRDAARKAMEEETSLRGLKERAKKELDAAKERMKDELLDAKSDAIAELEGLAMEKIDEVQEHGFAAVELVEQQARQEIEERIEDGGWKPR